ncbi:fibrinogen-like YCDxxxxGGGW domain-containing protein [Arthrobacter sp. NPDC057009]|uniref:fibrinogen-like YCDxxxxGGGW domain-containing protein n=1 Tax=Arthrobacter sp. NPDC057009 TaxID=3345996 RepID=UPI00362D26C3
MKTRRSSSGSPGTPRARNRARVLAAILAAALLPVSLLSSLPMAAATDEAIVRDGTTQLRAAASCWEIKQTAPSAPSGIYWLLTPRMPAPEQFFCDQETDGGGWVLIGRGREAWKEIYQGVGTTAQVRTTVTGTGAFEPRQLSATVIDGLLNGQAPDLLPDGFRLRRATSPDGLNWQEARFKVVNMDRWVWTFSAEHRVASFTFGLGNFSGGLTRSFGTDQLFNRVVTSEAEAQNWTQGWAFGSNIRGTTDASSYVWSATATTGNARPFTQMYLRPKLTQADITFAAPDDAGAPGFSQRPLPQNGAQPTVWGVTGLANGRTGEMNTEAQDFAQIGNTVYVGGNFRYVQRNSAGLDRVEQSYVAGFDVNTGEWVSTFRPVLNGQVKSLASLPNGKLVVGGEFTMINGAPAVGIAALDPVTGATDPGWRLQLENRITGAVVQVRGLSVRNDWLYLGGAFTHLTGGTAANPVYARAGARVRVTDGTPDAGWNPAFNGTVVAVDAAANGERLYASGYFSMSNNATAYRAAAVQTVAGAPLAPWTWTPSTNTGRDFQLGIQEAGNRVWLGGSEHSLFSFDPQTFARLSGNITRNGGDFQRVAEGGGVVYGGCHCGHWNYSNAFTWSNVGTEWTSADRINLVGAWDAASGDYIPDFNPVMKGRVGYGAWGIFVDSLGKVWTGGDFESSVTATGAGQWSGGFVNFPPRDSAAPGTPTGLTASTDGTTDTLSWTASPGQPSVYHVIRGDRVIATTTQTTVQVPALADARYFVRAADAASNYSASTAVVTPPRPPVQLVQAGAEWKYRFALEAPDPAWRTTSFDDSAWNNGTAPLGWGSTGIATQLTAEGTRPLSSHYRKTFTVADPGTVAEVNIVTRADDGVVLYLNGTEVTRVNMPAGTITNNSFATAAPRTNVATANPVRLTLPGSALAAGVNVLTAEVHSNFRSTPDHSFELTATAVLKP